MSDVPRKKEPARTTLNGIPSAMDELRVRQLLRDLGNIEKKGLQVRGTQTETARIYAHLSEIMLHDALKESRIRDIAHEELTEEEYQQFVSDLQAIHEENQQAHVRALRTGYGQLHDNIKGQSIPIEQESDLDKFVEGMKDIFGFGRQGK